MLTDGAGLSTGEERMRGYRFGAGKMGRGLPPGLGRKVPHDPFFTFFVLFFLISISFITFSK
jgi:hypothetical protein